MNRGRKYGSGRVYRRFDTWWLDYRDETGQRRRVSLDPSKREAERQRIEIIGKRDRILGGVETAPQDVGLVELQDRYLTDLQTRTTEMHVMNVRLVLARWVEFLPARTVRDVQPADVLVHVRETEHQVEAHLEEHIGRLPQNDQRSRAILDQMKTDEAQHGEMAENAGGKPLPQPVRSAMTFTSKIMKTLAYRF